MYNFHDSYIITQKYKIYKCIKEKGRIKNILPFLVIIHKKKLFFRFSRSDIGEFRINISFSYCTNFIIILFIFLEFFIFKCFFLSTDSCNFFIFLWFTRTSVNFIRGCLWSGLPPYFYWVFWFRLNLKLWRCCCFWNRNINSISRHNTIINNGNSINRAWISL